MAIPTWPRPLLQEGGFAPFLYYRVYGNPDPNRALSATTYRCEGIPAGITLHKVSRAQDASAFYDLLQPPLGRILAESLPDMVTLVENSQCAVSITGSPLRHDSLAYFRDVIGLITWLLDSGGTMVYDPMQFKCWSADDWRRTVFEDGTCQPDRHCIILQSEEPTQPTRSWLHTRGLRKFGRPDVSVRNVPSVCVEGAIELCNRLIDGQAMGMWIAEGETVRMKALPEGLVFKHGGDFDDPDFNNVHVEVCFP